MSEELKPCRDRDDNGRFKNKHGLYGSRLYHIWNGMNGRCNNPNNKDFRLYGARGITVCPEWHDSFAFFSWALSNGYNDSLTLDRIDCNKGYEPSNCRWISSFDQQKNRRNNHIIEFNNERHCISEWARITGISKTAILSRISRGWSIVEALTVPSSRSVTKEQRRKAIIKWEIENGNAES